VMHIVETRNPPIGLDRRTVSPPEGRIRVLGIAGSLRRGSYNRALLEAARELAPPNLELQIFDLADVPLYNGDVEAAGDPAAVRDLKAQIARADALLVATPEYNGAISGVLKNAIDWASRPPERALRGKTAAVIGATPGRSGTHRAQLSARQVLENVGAKVLPGPTVALAQAADHFAPPGRLQTDEVRAQLKAVLAALELAARVPAV
jgi:chromate reductase